MKLKEINNNIQESYCSFEVSKMLREKGFDCICKKYWSVGGHAVRKPENYALYSDEVAERNSEFNDGVYTAPTHALAIEWIRLNFGMWIVVRKNISPPSQWHYTIYNNSPVDVKVSDEYVISPQEATEAALLYTLKNLI